MSNEMGFFRVLSTENSWLMGAMSTAAGILTDKGLLSPSAMTSFRIHLSGMQGSKNRSMMDGLHQSQDILFTFISKELGNDHFRASAWLQFSDRMSSRIVSLLTKSHLELLELGKQNFNRFVSTKTADYYLAPQLLMDLNVQIAEDLAVLETPIHFMLHSYEVSDPSLARQLSESFCSDFIRETNMPKEHGRSLVSKRFAALYHILNARSDWQFFIDGDREDTKLNLVISQLRTLECSLGSTPDSGRFEENMKVALDLVEICERLLSDLLSALPQKFQARISPERPKNLALPARKVEGHLIQMGHAPEVAEEATSTLRAYLNTHNVSVRELLPDEASRIHPAIGSMTIDFVKSEEDLQKEDVFLKDKADRSFEKVSKQLLGILARVALIAGLFGLGACGVKGSLKSIGEPLRPEVTLKGPVHEVK